MSALQETGLLAIDVGNSQVKFGWFAPKTACVSELKPSELAITRSQLPQPEETLAVSHGELSRDQFVAQVGDWLDRLPAAEPRRFLASVHTGAAQWVCELLPRSLHALTAAELPLEVRVDEPEKVGVDRLLSAVAANRLRERNRSAVVVSLGTACTVNLIGADGAFEGGAILPGLGMSASALHTGTSALPLLSAEGIDPPADAVGKSTHAAISSGLIWGVVGAAGELIDRMTQSFEKPPQVFITGGDATRLVGKLIDSDGPARHVPNMVLAGIRIAAEER
ncbi:MAG: type III pantothenate kinase [Planctomycetes bacterium]|nr:type III pantothenate kinase [Planctomycetota bacterium]